MDCLATGQCSLGKGVDVREGSVNRGCTGKLKKLKSRRMF